MKSINLDDFLLHAIYLVGKYQWLVWIVLYHWRWGDKRCTVSYERFYWKGAFCGVMNSDYRLFWLIRYIMLVLSTLTPCLYSSRWQKLNKKKKKKKNWQKLKYLFGAFYAWKYVPFLFVHICINPKAASFR